MYKIIPKPKNIKYDGNGKFFEFDDTTAVRADSSIKIATDSLKGYLAQVLNIKLSESSDKLLDFVKNSDLPKEGYRITVSDNILVEYAEPAGALYAAVTLKQAIGSTDNKLPFAVITDEPLRSFRAFMLDTGRYFYEPKNIYAFIDLMVENKLNVFHWHISEDQGWRIEIDAYPELTNKGSRRSHTNFGMRPHGGFYKKSEVRDIVAYCAERNIDVIPELDMPGHSQAMLAAYPYLGCFDRKQPVATHWGVKHDILCAGKETTYEFIKTVIDELVELFPSEYFHIGGDEAPKTRWKLCPHCQAKIKQLNLKDENELQAYFGNVLCDYLKSKGKKTMAWNEYDYTEVCSKEIIWTLWNDPNGLYEKLNQDGRKFVNASSVPYYLDLTYYQNCLKDVYEYDPSGSVVDKSKMIGVETCLWTEFVPNMKKALKMMYPRITAFSERSWSHEYNYDDYLSRLTYYYSYLKDIGVPTPKSIRASNDKFIGLFEYLWFGRRVLYWAGLHNEIDNLKVRLRYSKKKY